MQHRVVDQVGQHLPEWAGVAFQEHLVRHGAVYRVPGLAHARAQRQQNLVHGLTQAEHAAVQTALVDGDLLEAGHQLGRLAQAAHQNGRALAGVVDELLQPALGQALGHVFAKVCGLVLQSAGHGQAVANRRIEFVCDTSHQRAQRREFFSTHQLGLRGGQSLQRAAEFAGACIHALFQAGIELQDVLFVFDLGGDVFPGQNQQGFFIHGDDATRYFTQDFLATITADHGSDKAGDILLGLQHVQQPAAVFHTFVKNQVFATGA